MSTESRTENSSVDTSNSNERTQADENHLEKGPVESQPDQPHSTLPCPDGGWRAWGVVLGVWIMQFVTFGYTNAFGIYNDFYVREYLNHFESSQISWIGSFQLFLLLSSGLFTGRGFDAGYFYKIMLGGSALFVFCLFMLSITHSQQYYQVFLAQGLGIGLASGVTYVPGLAVLSHWFHKRRPLAIGLATSVRFHYHRHSLDHNLRRKQGSAVGGFVHPIMLNQLFHGPLGFHNGVRVSAAMNIGLLAIGLLLVRTRLPPSNAPRNTFSSMKVFLRDPPYLATVFGTILVLAGLYYPFFFIQLNAIKNGVNATLAFYTVAIMNGASVVGRIIPNLLVHHFGVFNVVIFCILTSSILVFCTLAVKDVAGTVIFSILFGFFSGSYAGMLAPMVSSLAETDKEIGARLGICFTFTGLGGLVGTPIAGALLSSKFMWWRPILFSGLCVLSGGLCFCLTRFFLVRRRGIQRV
ncbi:Riboflavin transporter MCH5 [Leucoagaricus sp. SymC.cos]|nr:Riboflavin transporter MCH5 [Leucoagaricus sp. SymC.cos]